MDKKFIFLFVLIISILVLSMFVLAADAPSSDSGSTGIPVSGGGTNPLETSGSATAGGTATQTPPIEGKIEFKADASSSDPKKPVRQDISEYFGFGKASGSVFAEGIAGQSLDAKKTLDETTKKSRTTISGKGEAWVIIFSKEKEPREYRVGKNDMQQKLVFDEDKKLTEGTDFRVDKPKQGEQKIKVDIRGTEFSLNEGDSVKISKVKDKTSIHEGGINIETEQDRHQVEILTNKDITTPVKKDKKSEDVLVKYKVEGDKAIPWKESGRKDIQVGKDSTLRFDGEQAYHKKGETLELDSLNINKGHILDQKKNGQVILKGTEGNSNDNTLILTGKKQLPSTFKGGWMRIDPDSRAIDLGSTNDKAGPSINFQKGNPYLTNMGDKTHFAIQAMGNSEVNIKGNTDKSTGEIITKGRIAFNQDFKGGVVTENGEFLIKTNGVVIQGIGATPDTKSIAASLLPYKQDGKSYASLNGDRVKLIMSGENQYFFAKKDSDFAISNKYKYDGTNIPAATSSRVTYNLLSRPDQIKYWKLSENSKQLVLDSSSSQVKQILEQEYAKLPPNIKDPRGSQGRNPPTPSPDGKGYDWKDGDPGTPSSPSTPPSKDKLVNSIMSSSTRISAYDATGRGIGSGTIVGVKDNEVYILTAGHVVKGASRGIVVDIFDNTLQKNRQIQAKLISMDYDGADRDLALISIPLGELGGQVSPAKIAPPGHQLRANDPIVTSGCDNGRDCSLEYGYLKGSNENTMGLSNFNEHGRSGGGAFSKDGYLVGVDSAAVAPGLRGPPQWRTDPKGRPYLAEQGGIFNNLQYIQRFLDSRGFSWLYRIILSLIMQGYNEIFVFINIYY